jgi:hypothetical protein
MTRIVVTLHEELCTFIPVSFSVIILVRNISGKSCRENQNTNFMFSTFFSENRADCEIMWKNVIQRDKTTNENIIRRMRFACRITKATDTHSEYVTRIAFPLQQWLN